MSWRGRGGRGRGADVESDLFAEQRAAVRRPMLRLFTDYGRRHPVPFAVALAANAVSPLLALVPAFVLGTAIDALFIGSRPFELPFVPAALVPAGDVEQVYLAFAVVVLAYAASAVLSWAGSWGWTVFAERVQHAVRTDAYDQLQLLGMDFFTERQTGELLAIATSDVNELNGFLNGWLGRVLSIVVQFVGVAGITLALNTQLALVALAPAPVIFLLSTWFVRTVRPRYRAARATFGGLAARIENNLAGIEVVKSFTTERYESERVAEASSDHAEARWAARSLQIRFGPGLSLVTGLGFALVFVVGGVWVVAGPPGPLTGTLTVGTLVIFLDYSRQLTQPMTEAGFLLNNYEDVKSSAERVFGLLDYPISVDEREDSVELRDPEGRVEYDHVSFDYPERIAARAAAVRAETIDGDGAGEVVERSDGTDGAGPGSDGREPPGAAALPVLDDVSFAADAGDFVGVVGPTGSGKTTLMKLLLRLYDPDDGVVRVDGRDVREYTLSSLRGAVGYVSQEPFLFSGTVRDNIAYGRPDASDEAVEAAARRAAAHRFVTTLPDGYDTEVGQRGVKLSGGQRQRIAIARVVLRDPPMLLLDEATSQVDNETELLIQRALADLAADRTTFAIAHRLSTVRRADRILVMEDGEITERGTHDDLIERDGLYANLWRVQVGEYEELPEAFLEGIARRDAETTGE